MVLNLGRRTALLTVAAVAAAIVVLDLAASEALRVLGEAAVDLSNDIDDLMRSLTN